ncbi:MAG: nuclease-related domain-containing protein [Candidatus Nanopelagicales bacterium]
MEQHGATQAFAATTAPGYVETLAVPEPAPEHVDAAVAECLSAAEASARTGTEPEIDGYDLALNRPGQAARARAAEELAAMREKSRVGTWLARTLDVKTDERAWRVGADGEETIGAKLEKLTKDGWYVLHSVPVGKRGSDIDHVVIGPGGVFTVNTKKHPGKKVWVSKNSILVNGQRTDYLRNSRFEGERATKLLTAGAGFPVFVKPVLIFTTGTLIPDVTIKSRPDDVAILDRMDVPRAFKRSTVMLTPKQVAQVYAVARRSINWLS